MKILLVVAAAIMATAMAAGCAAGFVKEFSVEATRMAEYLWYGDRLVLPPPPSVEDIKKHSELVRKQRAAYKSKQP